MLRGGTQVGSRDNALTVYSELIYVAGVERQHRARDCAKGGQADSGVAGTPQQVVVVAYPVGAGRRVGSQTGFRSP